MVKAINDQNFVEETSKGVVLIDFWATWCGPCKMQGPVVEQLDQSMGQQVKFVKLDVDENQTTANEYHIMSIPTLLIKKDGKIVDKLVGFHPAEQLKATLSQYID